jgi:hypothetical protein
LNWVKEAESKLRDYAAKEQSLESVAERIAQLQAEMTCVRSATTDSTAVHGGGNCREDALLNNISERTELERAKQKTAEWVEWVNKALRALTDTDRHLLDVFYINRHKGYVERLCEEMNIEKSQVYNRKNAALRKFTISLYGVTET